MAPTAENLPKPGEVLVTRANEYEIIKLLGKGGFGAVFEVKSKEGHHFAAKCETSDVKKQVLSMDCRVLRGAHLIKSPHFCSLVARGKMPGRFRFIIMKLVGNNLWELRNQRPDRRFSLNTSLKLAEQCLVAIEDLHRVGYLHRDIKPGNFCIGRPENNEHHIVHLLDFGLARKFLMNLVTRDLRMPRAQAPFRGTTRYASLAAHRGSEQSRRDDLEAWFYMCVEWTAGSLPWRRLRGGDKDEVCRMKEEVRSGDACTDFLAECPRREFLAIMQYLDQLVYQAVPDYEFLYYCCQHAAKLKRIGPHDPIDWDLDHPYTGPGKEDRDKRIELVAHDDELQEEPTPTTGKSQMSAVQPPKE